MPFRLETLVLYADDDLLAVNKPAGLPTLPDGYNPDLPHVKSVLEPQFGRLWIVHRLDRYTSGVLLLARSAAAHRELNRQFAAGLVGKTYRALCQGAPDWQMHRVELPLRANGDHRHRTVVDPVKGKLAETELTVLEVFVGYTWIEARPHTGRTHQVHAHLAAAGLPLVGDELYGGEALYLSQLKPGFRPQQGKECPIVSRPALHAWALAFAHPSSGKAMTFSAPLPNDLRAALKQLRRYRPCTDG